jgi:hypothetical protein
MLHRLCDLNPTESFLKILWENLDLLQITPAPAKTIGKAIISSQKLLENLRVCFNSIACHIARSFFMATTFAKSFKQLLKVTYC